MRKMLILKFSIILSTAIVLLCSFSLLPIKKYDIQVGETFRIYYKTNPCCNYCITPNSLLNSIQIIGHESSDSCATCQKVQALVIQAISKGKDTIQLNLISADGNCENIEDFYKTEQYIIEVK